MQSKHNSIINPITQLQQYQHSAILISPVHSHIDMLSYFPDCAILRSCQQWDAVQIWALLVCSFRQSTEYVVVSHCSFNLHFRDDSSC